MKTIFFNLIDNEEFERQKNAFFNTHDNIIIVDAKKSGNYFIITYKLEG